MSEKYMELLSKTDGSTAMLQIYQVRNGDIGIELATFGKKDFIGSIRFNLDIQGGGYSGNTHEALCNLLDGKNPQTIIEIPDKKIGRIGDMLEMGKEYNALFLTPQQNGILVEIQRLEPGMEGNKILSDEVLLTIEIKPDIENIRIQTSQEIINALNALYLGMMQDNKESPYRNPENNQYLENLKQEIGNLEYI